MNRNSINKAGKNTGNNTPANSARLFPNKGVQQQSSASDGLGGTGAREEEIEAKAVRIQELPQPDVHDRHKMAKIEWFESAISELIALAKKQPLRNPRQLARAKQLMCDLKLMGFSPKEMEELTGHAWKEPTVKQYTQGVKATESDVKEHLVNVLVRAINTGTGLQDVADVAQLKESLAQQEVDIEQVAGLIALVKQTGEDSSRQLEIKEVIEAVETMKSNGISPERLHEVLPYITAIAEEEGEFNPDAVRQIAQVSQKFGGISKTLEAIDAFDKLQDIDAKTQEKKQDYREAQEDLKECQAQLQKAQDNLNLYQKLEEKGYDTNYLGKFDQFVRRYGRGKLMSEQFLEQAVSTYSSVGEIAAREAELRGKVGEAEAKLRRLQIDHASYARSIDLCHDLLFKYKLSPEVIKRMHEQLEVYGGVPGFLDALEKFRGIDDLRNGMQAVKANISRLRGEEQLLVNSTQKWRGQFEDGARTAQFLAGSVMQQLKRQAELSMEEISRRAEHEMSRMKEASEEYAEVMAKIKTVEEELRVARYVMSPLKYPEEARGLPREYGYAFIVAALRFVQANNIDPSANGVPAELVAKYPVLQNFALHKFTLQEILTWALKIAASDTERLW